MDGKTHPYLDLAAVPVVGETMLDPRPAFVIAADGTRFLFANAAGMALFGERSMGDLLRREIGALNPLKEQAARLARQLSTEQPRLEMLKIGRGVAMSALPAACLRLNLDRDARAVLAVAAGGEAPQSLATRAEQLVEALAANDCEAAVVDERGKMVAASANFDALDDDEPALHALIDAAIASANRLTRRPAGDRTAGVVRFEDRGRTLFLVIVGPAQRRAESDVAAPHHAHVPVETMLPSLEDEDKTGAADAHKAAVEVAPAGVEIEAPAEAMLPAAEPIPPSPLVQFVFQLDREGRVTFASPELAATVGDDNGAIGGHLWSDVADALGFTLQAGESGTVRWPAGDRDTVSVALAVSPVKAGDTVTGFRGFGTIDIDDRAPDERVEPTTLGAPAPSATADESEPEGLAADTEDDDADLDDAARKSVEGGQRFLDTGRYEPPPLTSAPPPTPPTPSNVVRLPGAASEMRLPEHLSEPERDAFRRIAEALGARRAEEAAAPAPTANDPAEAKSPPRKEAAARAPTAEIDTRLLDRLPIGIAIFRDRKTLFANRTLLEFLFYDSFARFLDAGGAEAIFPGHAGLAGNIAEAGGNLAALRRDGVRVPVKAWLHAVTFAGTTALMLSIIPGRDRPSENEDELTLELARSEAKVGELTAILDTATDGVLVIDERGRIGSMNRAAEALFGVNGREYAGRYFTDLIADESQKGALDYLDGLASNGVASVLNDGREVIGRVPAGGLIPLFMTMGRLGDANKFCAVLRDITHWKNVEAEMIAARRAAETANAQKSEFLAKVSHEIRTPLNAIIGFSEMMMSERFGPVGNQRYRDYLRDINVSGAHLVSLINDLLDLSKIEAGKVDLSFEAVPVNATIQECVAIMQPQANRERIIIRTSLAADVPNVVADPRSLRQILLNLISNAIKFTRAGGQVIVSSSLEATGEVTVRIRDTGIGMNEKDLETALKPFRQVSPPPRGERDQGTGLGLPLTKAMVEANRASFAIDSAPNQGTLVKITFPTTRVLAG